MFYCEECRKTNKWPESMSKSRGKCEVCEQPAVCYNVPSSHLPTPAMSDTERGLMLAEYLKQMLIGIDLMLIDEENIKFLERGIQDTKKRLATGYAFPLADYSKLDNLQVENTMLEAVLAVCKQRQIYKTAMSLKPKKTLDDAVLGALGLVDK